MKKLLYITVSPSPKEESISKKLGGLLVEKFMEKFSEFKLESLDLYTCHLPEMSPKYLMDEIKLVEGEAYNRLLNKEKKEVDRIDELSDQFLEADAYIIAAPMWDLSFPAKLKQYIDCICLGGKVIAFGDEKKKPKGLLGDKERTMIYLQTAGGDFPFFLETKVNYGVEYCKDLFKGLGIKTFKKVLIEGVVQYEDEKERYLDEAYFKINKVIDTLNIDKEDFI